jgi:hypothetical protein
MKNLTALAVRAALPSEPKQDGDYIILMGPGHYSGPIEVTAVKTGETLAGNIGRVLDLASEAARGR